MNITPKETAEAWVAICRIYDETIDSNNPVNTLDKVIEELGMDKTVYTFAAVSAIKKHDGRIYGRNREYMNSIEVDPLLKEWSHDNPLIETCRLDHIHTAHIDNLITQLRKKVAA